MIKFKMIKQTTMENSNDYSACAQLIIDESCTIDNSNHNPHLILEGDATEHIESYIPKLEKEVQYVVDGESTAMTNFVTRSFIRNIDFPLTFQTKCEFDKFLTENKSYVYDLYQSVEIDKINTSVDCSTEELEKINSGLTDENVKLRAQLESATRLIELQEKSIGTSSVYKGEFNEKVVEKMLVENFGEYFEIDGDKKMKCMDIRMTDRVNRWTVGVEIKCRTTLMSSAIVQFQKDKTANAFKGGIFLSCESPIPKKVMKEDTFVIEDNELFIYSKNPTLVIPLISFFITRYLTLTEKNTDAKLMLDVITLVYNQWNKIKRESLEMDKELVKAMSNFGLGLQSGHLYLNPKTKCIANREPY